MEEGFFKTWWFNQVWSIFNAHAVKKRVPLQLKWFTGQQSWDTKYMIKKVPTYFSLLSFEVLMICSLIQYLYITKKLLLAIDFWLKSKRFIIFQLLSVQKTKLKIHGIICNDRSTLMNIVVTSLIRQKL